MPLPGRGVGENMRKQITRANLVPRIQGGRHRGRSQGPVKSMSARCRTLAASLERFFRCDESVETHGQEDPHVTRVVEHIVAGGAQEDEVFEGVEIRELDYTTALQLAELDGEVSFDSGSRLSVDVRVGGPEC